jgi:MFS family permease
MIGAVFGLAFIIGPVVGGLLLKISWHVLFYINIPIALGIIIAAWRILPSSHPAEQKPFDWPGLLVITVILGSLSLGLNQIGGEEFRLWPLLLIAVGMGLLSVFGAIENRAADPIFRFRMLGPGSRQLLLANALALGSGIGMMSVSFLPTLITSAFPSVSASNASFMLIPLVLAMMVGAPLSGKLLDSIGSKIVVVVGTSTYALSVLLLALVPLSFVSYYVASVLLGVGLSALLGAPLRYIVINAAPIDDRGTAQGAISVITGVGQLLCAALVGSIAGSFGGVDGYRTSYLLIGFIAVGMLLVALRLKGRADELDALAEHEPGPSSS